MTVSFAASFHRRQVNFFSAMDGGIMEIQVENTMRRDSRSSTNTYQENEEPQEVFVSIAHDEDGKRPSSSEQLEMQITNRAQEIAQQRNNDNGNNLASWLKAAKEILSEDSVPSS
jgi:hypothetical protein